MAEEAEVVEEKVLDDSSMTDEEFMNQISDMDDDNLDLDSGEDMVIDDKSMSDDEDQVIEGGDDDEEEDDDDDDHDDDEDLSDEDIISSEEEEDEEEEESEEEEDEDEGQRKKKANSKDSEKEERTNLITEKDLAILNKPIKANGKNVQLKSVEDAIKLIQMGLGYNKRVKELKDKTKIADLLEQNGITSDQDVNFLLDLHNKDKSAISKLMKDADIDPLDIDPDEEGEYEAKDYKLESKDYDEEALNSAIDKVRETDTGEEAIDLLANQWDSKSHDFALQNPEVIVDINQHMELGIYKAIVSAVEYKRSLGEIGSELSDIEAYMMIGLELEKDGVISASNSNKTKPSAQSKASKSKIKQSAKIRKNVSKRSKGKKTPAGNTYNMTDKEFEEMAKDFDF